eukprot:gene40402-15617_t
MVTAPAAPAPPLGELWRGCHGGGEGEDEGGSAGAAGRAYARYRAEADAPPAPPPAPGTMAIRPPPGDRVRFRRLCRWAGGAAAFAGDVATVTLRGLRPPTLLDSGEEVTAPEPGA